MRPRLLHVFALFTAGLTFTLLGAGGLVTSHGVGMAVPDWPNTFGYNMFFFPFSQWVGGVFYEHSHRLLASGVGLCATVLAIWLYGRPARRFLRWTGAVLLALAALVVSTRPAHWRDAVVLALSGAAALGGSLAWPRGEPARPWLRRLGVVAFFAVVLQGVLGGLRVVLFKAQIGIFHATLAQLFFALTCALALFTSRWWQERFGSAWSSGSGPEPSRAGSSPGLLAPSGSSRRLAWLCLGATTLILVQLILGATMRHQHAGLSIPDFPLAYGKLWPATDPHSVAHYNEQRIEVVDLNPITAPQIVLQMVHRLVALLILSAVGCAAWFARREPSEAPLFRRLTLVWLGLILLQGLLGAATIWSNKAADIATAHVMVGAITLALGTILCLILLKALSFGRQRAAVLACPQAQADRAFGGRPASAFGVE